jgi:hypothetical protein
VSLVVSVWRGWSLNIDLSSENNVTAADVGSCLASLTVDVLHTTIPRTRQRNFVFRG